MRLTHLLPMALGALPTLISCSEGGNAPEEAVQTTIEAEERPISVDVARMGRFNEEIVANGKVVPLRSADIYWQTQGIISSVRVANGQRVSKGDVIATLDTFRLSNAAQGARASMESARLAMNDVLIGQGYDPSSDSIPARLREIASIKSGFLAARVNYANALRDLENATVRAPFGGVVANLEAREANMASSGRPLCRVTDSGTMRVEFSVIESELGQVRPGTKVRVEAYAQPGRSHVGRVDEVNPVVDASGMATARARVDGGAELMEGMNVRIWIDKGVGDYVSVPKASVVRRSERSVVFTVKNGESVWNYVTVATESSDRVAISEGIADGDTVVVEGANDLAHKTRVKY